MTGTQPFIYGGPGFKCTKECLETSAALCVWSCESGFLVSDIPSRWRGVSVPRCRGYTCGTLAHLISLCLPRKGQCEPDWVPSLTGLHLRLGATFDLLTVFFSRQVKI